MRKKVFRILCIIFLVGIFMSVFYPWTVLNGESYTIIEFYKQAVFRNDYILWQIWEVTFIFF